MFTDYATGVKYIAYECYENGFGEYIISPPRSNTLTNNKEYKVEIFTMADNDPGIPFPVTNIKHIF